MSWKSAAANQMIPEIFLIVHVLVQSLFLRLSFQLKVAAPWTAQSVAVPKVRAAYRI